MASMDVNEDYVDSENLSLESVNIEDPESPTAPQKRKGDIAHDVRPNPRFSDLFNSPASGAPIIIQLISEPCSFRPWNFTVKKNFIAGLITLIGQVRPGTKWTQRGELYIYPTSNKQKNLLLQQTQVNEHAISCSLCKSEQEVKGVMYNVPPNNTEEELLDLLSSQGVIKVKRFSNLGPNNATNILPMVTLFFNTKTLPREVTIAHEIFTVKKYIPRPSLCRKCWTFGHPEEVCSVPPVCRKCASTHEEDDQCKSPKKCPTCSKSDHAAGTAACPIFANKQKIIKFAYENNMSVTEAGRLHSGPAPESSRRPPAYQHTTEDASIRQEIDSLKKKIEEMQKTAQKPSTPPETETRLQNVEKEISSMKTQMAPLLKLETQMSTGFTSLDNRMTMLQDMLMKDLNDRAARRKEKDQMNRPEHPKDGTPKGTTQTKSSTTRFEPPGKIRKS
jgi:hypothetical protein